MKVIKKLVSGILVAVMLLCAAVLVCAFNPALTEALADKVGAGETREAKEETEGAAEETGEAEGTGRTEEETGKTTEGRGGGYEPVRGEGEQITDEDAQALQAELQTGDTGEDLSFDAKFYPYYQMLDQELQALYRQIYANAWKLTESFAPIVDVTVEQVTKTFEAVLNDHPELFWLETGYSCKHLKSGDCIQIMLQYHVSAEEFEKTRAEFLNAADEILQGAENLASDSEKEKYIHDALIARVTYEETAEMGQSAYSALVEGESVCAGYARAFQYLMQRAGIPCFYCTGFSGEDHAWNIVQLEEGYYHVDVTWDDTEPPIYDYYNRTDVEFADTHERKGMSVYLPVCGGLSETEEMEKTEETEVLINPNPAEPLTWDGDVHETEETADTETDLEKAGLTEEEVLRDLSEYYADCLEQMKTVGAGQQQFVNAVPESLWESIERVYSDKSYLQGYVNSALKELGKEYFAIQLQAERLNGGYYRLYHNVSTW